MSVTHEKLRLGFGTGVAASILLAAMSLLTPSITEASIITIEPDDFAEGTDLSSVSSYVSLQSLVANYREPGPIYATRSRPEYRAPTGELVFGNFGAGIGILDECETDFECAIGFGMTFHQPVRWVSLLYQNWGYPFMGGYGLPNIWYAFDVNGDRIEWGVSSTMGDTLGQVFSLNLAIPGMKSLVVGGGATINAMEYDRLSFAVGVPEPAPLALLAVGLGAVIFARNRKLLTVVK
ncbi:PEP-CTERM sorting domain-containing protein [Marinobacter sp. SS13-12]|uniref:PEP-CTERM sorting domain-containing protein n=1 Tax=Marinobacter sp. SS13-12 TaxID=3050451 RepID=UPI002552DCEF|nr:PEP-CTERM sorting domain-containing protein [Marinobacter sp. SS13-12]MDK8464273.1 PEP-CTERM sorting domain-containing protein [Marinobacter sp. SS13-12]